MAKHMAGQDAPARSKVVCIGGGTGQPRTIEALRGLDTDIVAVVAMADDGGSTGRLREATGALPPGDLRKCLIALAQDPDGLFARSLNVRMKEAKGHAIGNLLLHIMADEAQSMPDAIATMEGLLGCVGHVLPSTLEDIHLSGITRDGQTICGEHLMGEGPCTIDRAWLDIEQPVAYQPAVDAIMSADMVVIGPGSLYTSLIPNLLVPGIANAIRETGALRVFVCPKADTQGETWGLTASEYVDALERHGLEGAIDVVLLNRVRDTSEGVGTRSFRRLTKSDIATDFITRMSPRATVMEAFARRLDPDYMRPVAAGMDEQARIETHGILVVARDFTDEGSASSHNVDVLRDSLRGLLASCRLQQR